jgi:hypothetical protein
MDVSRRRRHHCGLWMVMVRGKRSMVHLRRQATRAKNKSRSCRSPLQVPPAFWREKRSGEKDRTDSFVHFTLILNLFQNLPYVPT